LGALRAPFLGRVVFQSSPFGGVEIGEIGAPFPLFETLAPRVLIGKIPEIE